MLRCRKTQQDLPEGEVRCPAPDQPCKFRSECVVYALWLAERQEKAWSGQAPEKSAPAAPQAGAQRS